MRAGKVIADSDDEDDFSPVPSPLRALSSSSARSVEGGGAGSADPGFFQSAYLARQDAAARDAGSDGGPLGPTPDGGEVAPRTGGADGYDPWALMSSPDELRNTPKGKTAVRSTVSKAYSKKDSLVSSDTSPKDGPGIATPVQNDSPSKVSRTYLKKDTGVSSNDTSPKNVLGIGTPGTKNVTPSKAMKTYSRKDPDVGSSATSAHEIIDLVSPDQRNMKRPTSKAAKRNVKEADDDHGQVSTRPLKKKRISDLRVSGRGGLEDGSADVPASFDGSPGTSSMAPPTKQNARSSSSGDSGRLYVETSKMTASQKQQYEEVSFPSLSSIDEPNLRQYTHLARSSGDATIAYPTPTQYRRADPSMPAVQESPSPVIPKRGSTRERMSSLPPTADNPGSSPDVISGAQEGDAVAAAAAAEAGPRVTEQDNSCDEDWNEEEFGFPRQQEPRLSRTKKRSRPPEQDTEPPLMQDGISTTERGTESAGAQETSAAQESVEQPPIPKKRGRKKKDKAPEPEPEPEPAGPAAEDQQPEDAPPQKRKRGRPRKSHKAGATDSNEPAQDAKVPDPDARSETSHNMGDGSEGAGCRDTGAKEDGKQDSREDGGTGAKTDGEGDAEGVSPGRRVLAGTVQEAAGTSAAEGGHVPAGRGSAADGEGEVAERAQATPGKVAAPQTPGVKPIYRVGLSRRSRIAPLLKVIRKD